MENEKTKLRQIVVKSYSDVAKGSLSFLAPSNSLTLLSASNGPGGSDSANSEELGRKVVTSE